MAGSTVDIRWRGTQGVGVWKFEEAPKYLHAVRTANGCVISLPIRVELWWSDEKQPCPLVTDLRAEIRMLATDGVLPLGVASSRELLSAARPKLERELVLDWQLPLAVLAMIERKRDGDQVKFSINCAGELCFLLTATPQLAVRSEPATFGGQVELVYPKDLWIAMLRNLNVAANVLVEFPLPSAPPHPWDGIWKALSDAREHFERGGSTGWKGCANAVRFALEQWQKVEKEDMGPGWTAPKQPEREARTKQQRLDNVRWHLLQLAHLSIHTPAEDWNRDEALLQLSALAALLAVRKP